MSNTSGMGTVSLWLGPAGCGKTGMALSVLREELDRGWQGVRLLAPTVGHKQSIEHLLLGCDERRGLIGDPVTTFFNFAEEVVERSGVRVRRLSELQKHLLLKKLIRETPLSYFERARAFPGFVLALGEAIDELKVHMIRPEALLAAAEIAGTRGAAGFARKLHELGVLYQQFQTLVYREDLFDNEGIMWIAAEHLANRPALFADLRCLILDGFARLTPIQVEFLRAFATRQTRIITLFDYQEGRSVAYHPVEESLRKLDEARVQGGFTEERRLFDRCVPAGTTLAFVRTELFCERPHTCDPDDSLHLLVGATPAHEAELIARAVRALLREGRLDGKPVTVDDIAILARNADSVRERLARTFRRFGLSLREEPPLLAHTPVGRALLATLRLIRDDWKREDLLTLLKSGFLAIDPAVAFEIDLAARTRYLRSRKVTWLSEWPDEATAEVLRAALAPIAMFDEAFRQHGLDAAALLQAVEALLEAFRVNALPAQPPLPDEHPAEAARYREQTAAFAQAASVLTELRGLDALLGGFRREELIELVTTSLLHVRMPARSGEGVALLSAHTTGGQKFPVVFLCDLLQGVFPRRQRESAFLLDHERDETLRDLNVLIDTRKHLEEDEQFWFLHALSSATRRLVLSYPAHDGDGRSLETSTFVDEVLRLAPALVATAGRTSFRDVVPPLEQAESAAEFLAGLVLGLRTARDRQDCAQLAVAYTASAPTHRTRLAAFFRAAQSAIPALVAPNLLDRVRARPRAYSASELQSYLDCPFLWFGAFCLAVRPVVEEYGPLDRGAILHAVLEQLYRGRQRRPGEPVHLEGIDPEALWPEVEAALRERLAQEPRFTNRPTFLRDIEMESLCRLLRRFIANEIVRARTRRTHPAYFERHFGSGRYQPLLLGDGTVPLRGVIDRIDLVDDNPECAVVVDYKTSAGMTLKELESGTVLQAPIYALALERVTGFTPLGVEFMDLRQGEGKGIFHQDATKLYGSGKGMKTLDAVAWQAYLAACETRLVAAAGAMAAGHIPLSPMTKHCPRHCDYLSLCRGEPFSLEEIVRAGNSETHSVAE